MKKKLIAFFLAVVVTGACFAKDKYFGDVQVYVGYTGNHLTQKLTDFDYKSDFKVDSALFSFGIDSTHLFALNDLFSLGFKCGTAFAYGKPYKASFENYDIPSDLDGFLWQGRAFVGPVAGFTFGNAVRITVAPAVCLSLFEGFLIDNEMSSPVRTSDFFPIGIGFDVGLQAKLLPKSTVSPVVGYKFSANWTSSLVSKEKEKNGTKTYEDLKYTSFSNLVYLGVSFNW